MVVNTYPPDQAFPRRSGSAIFHAASVLTLFAAATCLVRPPLAVTGATTQEYDSSHTLGRRFQVNDVRCLCGTKKVLNVNPLDDADCRQLFITAVTTKTHRHGIKVKMNQSTLSVNVPAKVLRNSRESGFYLKFSTERSMKREKARHRTCYKVVMNKSDKKACRKGLRCEATMTKRPRRLVTATFLPVINERSRLVSINRLSRRKRSSDESKKKRKGKSRKWKRMPRNLPREKQNQIRTTTIMPQISESFRCSQTSCSDWRPKVYVKTVQDQVTVTYEPVNCLAEEMELTLQIDYHLAHQQMLLPNATTYMFPGVKPGKYRAGVRPRGSKCHVGTEFVSEYFTINDPDINSVKHTTVCTRWHPSVNASVQDNAGMSVIVIYYETGNLNASYIEVALETEDNHKVQFTNVPPNMQPVNFTDVAPGRYFALVRPVGCTDCADYRHDRSQCNPAFTTSSTFTVHATPPKPRSESEPQSNTPMRDAETESSHSNRYDFPSFRDWSAAPKHLKVTSGRAAAEGARGKPAAASDGCNCRACCDSCRAYGSV